MLRFAAYTLRFRYADYLPLTVFAPPFYAEKGRLILIYYMEQRERPAMFTCCRFHMRHCRYFRFRYAAMIITPFAAMPAPLMPC